MKQKKNRIAKSKLSPTSIFYPAKIYPWTPQKYWRGRILIY